MTVDTVLLILGGTFVAAFAGGYGFWLAPRTWPKVTHSFGRALYWLSLMIKWPLNWIATEFKERRRVSRYKHRPITWCDLAQEEKNNVRFHHLGEPARELMKIHNLPRTEKYSLLDKFILPHLFGSTLGGTLHLFDEANRLILGELVHVTVPREDITTQIGRDTITLEIHITFDDPQNQFPCPVGREIGFSSQSWHFVGRIQQRSRLVTGRAFAKSKKGVGYDGMEVSDGTLVNAAGRIQPAQKATGRDHGPTIQSWQGTSTGWSIGADDSSSDVWSTLIERDLQIRRHLSDLDGRIGVETQSIGGYAVEATANGVGVRSA